MVHTPPRPTTHQCRYNERGVLEVQLFNIQMKLQAAKQRIWYPPEGKLISDINKAWVKLEAAEHAREVALRKELQRQERLEQLAEKFNRKAGLRESWLEDMFQVLYSVGLSCIRNLAWTRNCVATFSLILLLMLSRFTTVFANVFKFMVVKIGGDSIIVLRPTFIDRPILLKMVYYTIEL